MEYREIYHCCRWCKHFSDGFCQNDQISTDARCDIYDAIYHYNDMGNVSKAVNSSLTADRIINSFKTELEDTRLSKKAIKGLLGVITERIEDLLTDEIYGDIADAATNCILKHLKDEPAAGDEIYIQNPESFWCKYYE